ncbi:MAG: tRNA preQ1(34) S-adenosylmethionine ribosyltransferase-isomerase QueA [Gammaproteobacteria bacterium]|nr:tRNA preQ1(34) S-adenosylmethionine ribosyltransferase-isomerase QueA [Gammaproteobacteria bacterium]
MRRADFQYELPEEQIALYPCESRSGSRLLCLDPRVSEIRDCLFSEITRLLKPGDLLVFNDTRVIPARLLGAKESGGRVEVLVERIGANHKVLAHIRASKSPKPGSWLILDDVVRVLVVERVDDLFRLQFPDDRDVLEILDEHGHVPLPPYIKRDDETRDYTRYQTVYARAPGAVAAPTAGLHFDGAILEQLARCGIEQAFVTLHIGAGTFQPVRADRLEDHVMHYEYFEISAAVCEKIAATRRKGGRVVAVGTTVVRTLEAAVKDDLPRPYKGETNLFITPGYRFRCVDALLTNFHLSESTLLMLVCAFAGYERVMAAYQHAITEGYRFYSYGDAMFIGSRDVA